MPTLEQMSKTKKSGLDLDYMSRNKPVMEEPSFFQAMDAAHSYTDIITKNILSNPPGQPFKYSPQIQARIEEAAKDKVPLDPDTYELVQAPSSQELFETELNSIWQDQGIEPNQKKLLIEDTVKARKKRLYQEISSSLNTMYEQKRLSEEQAAQKGKRLTKYKRSWDRGWGRVAGAGLQLLGEVSRSKTLKDEARFMHLGITSPEMASFNDDWIDWVLNTTLDTAPFMITAMAPAAATGGATIPSTIGSFTVAFAVEGNSAYQTALDRNEPENKARIRGVLTGLINGGIELGGGGSMKYFKTSAINKTMTKLAKVRHITKNIFKNALREGLAEEVPQEAVQMIVGGDVPKNTDGSVNWSQVADRLLEAGAAGSLLGFGGSTITSIKTSLSGRGFGDAAISEIINSYNEKIRSALERGDEAAAVSLDIARQYEIDQATGAGLMPQSQVAEEEVEFDKWTEEDEGIERAVAEMDQAYRETVGPAFKEVKKRTEHAELEDALTKKIVEEKKVPEIQARQVAQEAITKKYYPSEITEQVPPITEAIKPKITKDEYRAKAREQIAERKATEETQPPAAKEGVKNVVTGEIMDLKVGDPYVEGMPIKVISFQPFTDEGKQGEFPEGAVEVYEIGEILKDGSVVVNKRPATQSEIETKLAKERKALAMAQKVGAPTELIKKEINRLEETQPPAEKAKADVFRPKGSKIKGMPKEAETLTSALARASYNKKTITEKPTISQEEFEQNFADAKNEAFDQIWAYADDKGWDVEDIDEGYHGFGSKYLTIISGEKSIRVRVSDHIAPEFGLKMKDYPEPDVDYVLKNPEDEIDLSRLDKFLPTEKWTSPFNKGDIVEHPKFGKGIVKSAKGLRTSNQVTIKFDTGETKVILTRYGILEKLTPSPAQPIAAKAEEKEAEEEKYAERERLLSPGRRNRLLRQLEKEIEADDIYSSALEEQNIRDLEIGDTVYYVDPGFKGEVKAAIQSHPSLKFRITTTDTTRTSWDKAVQQAIFRAGTTREEMDISDFLDRLAEITERQKKYGRLNAHALEEYEKSGWPFNIMKAEKYRMLYEGAIPEEINENIREIAEHYGVEDYEDELVGPEPKKLKKIRQLEGQEREKALWALAEEDVRLQERRAAKNAVEEVLKANDIDAELKEVETIDKVKIQRDLLGKPVFTPATVGKTKELGIEPGQVTEKEVSITYELSQAVAGLANQNITEPKEVAATLMEKKGWKELFNNPTNPLPEVRTAVREATEGRQIPFELRGEPVGAAITTPAGEQIVLLAYGADSETGYHEGYHILRGHLTAKDQRVLDKHFKNDIEAEARSFAEFVRTGKVKVGYLRGIWNKLIEKLKKVKSALQGRGYRSVNDIFGEIIEGKIEKITVINKEGLLFEVKMPEEYEARLVDARLKGGVIGKKWLIEGKALGTIGYADNYEQAIEKAWAHKNKASTGISSMEKKAEGQPSHVFRPALAGEKLPVPDVSEVIVTDDRAIAHLPQQDQPRTEPEIPEEANVETTKGITARQVKNKFSDEKNICYATGDVVKGDIIRFEEGVFGGSYKKPKFLGQRTVVAEILKDSYGSEKQQHTFTIKVLYSYGYDSLEPGRKTTRKGRNIYRNGTERLEWTDKSERDKIAEEKHERGDRARQARQYRREHEGEIYYETMGERMRREAEHRAQVRAAYERRKAQVEKKPKKRTGRLKIELHDYTPSLPGLGQEPGSVKTPRPGMRVKTDVKATPKLGEEFEEAELPGGKIVEFRESEFGPAPAPNRRATKAELEENRRQQKRIMQAIQNLKQASQTIGHSAEKRIFEVSERLRWIDPELKRQVRLREEYMAKRINRDLKDREGFLKKSREMSREDWLDFDYAASIGDNFTVNRLAAKYNMIEDVAKIREILDGIYEGHIKTGRKVYYRENLWPRRVKDREGLLNALIRKYGRSNILGPYEAALERRRQQAGGRQLTEEERAQVLNSMIRGFGQRIWLSRPGILKTRSLWEMTPELKKYYYDTRQSLDMYIVDSHDAISAAEFFGKTTKQILDLRAQRSRLATRLHKLSTRVGYKRPMTEPKYREHISKARERFEMVNQQLNDLQDMSIQDSIGAYIFGLVANGQLTHKQEARINQILEAYFQPKKMSRAVRGFKAVAYMTTIGNHLQTLTQLKDYARILYRSPLDTVPATARAIIPGLKSKYTMDELSIEATSIDIEGLSKILDGTLTTVSFRRVDRIMKEIYVDAVMSRYYRQAKSARNIKEGSTFRERIEAHMGKETEQTIKDLREGKKTELTKRLAFNEVLDMHPVARSELTEQYLRGGGTTKALYTLRTFGLKEFTYAQREIISGIKEHPKRNVGRLVWLAFTVALAGGNIESLKDIIRGRRPKLANNVIDEWLRLLLMSRYTVGIMKKEGPAKGYLRSLLPPSKMIDAPVTDIVEGELKETPRLIPIVGEEYYWWFGGGREKELRKQGKEDWLIE